MAIDDRIQSRRTFLQSGTALAAATALGGLPRAFAAGWAQAGEADDAVCDIGSRF